MKLILIMGTALLLSACMTSYVPYDRKGFARYGYTHEQVEPDLFIVVFAGSGQMSRKRVFDFATLRGAELCKEHEYGYWYEEDTTTRSLHMQHTAVTFHTARRLVRCLDERRTAFDLDVNETIADLRNQYNLGD